MDQFEAPAPNKLIAAMQLLGNKKPYGVNSLYSAVPQHFLGTYLGPEPLDANLAQIRLQGGTTVRFVPTLAGLGLVAGNVVKLEKSSVLPLHVVGKLVGNINLASDLNTNVSPPGPPGSYAAGIPSPVTQPVTWAAGADHFGAGLSYQIYLNNSYRMSTAVGATAATITGLTGSTTYTSYLIATDGAGNTSAKSNTISFTTAAPAGDPPSTLITKTYKAVALRSYNYNGNNERDTWHDGSCYQGDDATGAKNQSGLIFFDWDQISADMHNKDMTQCKITVTYAHWWFGNGTAVIGTHNYTSTPGTISTAHTNDGQVFLHSVAGSPLTATLGPNIADEFRTGASRGIMIGPGSNGSQTYYGYTYGAGTHVPVLSLTYQT